MGIRRSFEYTITCEFNLGPPLCWPITYSFPKWCIDFKWMFSLNFKYGRKYTPFWQIWGNRWECEGPSNIPKHVSLTQDLLFVDQLPILSQNGVWISNEYLHFVLNMEKSTHHSGRFEVNGGNVKVLTQYRHMGFQPRNPSILTNLVVLSKMACGFWKQTSIL